MIYNATKKIRYVFLYRIFFAYFLFQFSILFIADRLAPLVGGLLAGYFYCQMAEPAVRCGTVPVFHTCRDVDAVARFHLDGFFSFFLIVTASCHAYQDLSAAALCVMDVPVVTTSRFECYIEDTNLAGRYRCQIAFP